MKNYKKLYQEQLEEAQKSDQLADRYLESSRYWMEKYYNEVNNSDYYRTEASGLLAKLKEAERDMETAKQRIELIRRAYESERARRERGEQVSQQEDNNG